MSKGIVLYSVLLVFLLVGTGATLGCDTVRGGAEVWLQNVSAGSFTQSGKTITGIPTGNLSVVLKGSTNKVFIDTTDKGFVIKLSPSNAVITTGPDGISITGVSPDQMELKFNTQKTTTK